jgi:hypothetical protein
VKNGRTIVLAMMLLAVTARPGIAQTSPSPLASAEPSDSPTATASPTATPVPIAGVIPPTLEVQITGSPSADAAFISGQIRDALDRAIRPTLAPGAAIDYGPIAPFPIAPLAAGAQAVYTLTVSLSGVGGVAPINGVATVNVTNVVNAYVAPVMLFLSDDPEYVRSEGLIARNDVTAARPARLYYYHSDIGVPRDLDVLLTAAAPTRVHVIASGAGPELDVLDVGHAVTRDLLYSQHANEGTIVDLVPGVPFSVRHALMLQGEVVAGSVDVAVLSGGTATLSVIASAAGGSAAAYLNGPRQYYDGHHRHGAFALAGYGDLAATFTVGGPPAAVQYGARVPTPANLVAGDDGRDYGDYGVVHRIVFTMVNATDDPHPVFLYEKPLGGPVRSTFVIDGTFKEIGCVRLEQPYYVATYQLPPHSTSASTTVTMTDGGSFYPIEYGVTDAAPESFTPRVGSPDGCSPNAPAFHEPSPLPSASTAPSPTAPPVVSATPPVR